MKIDTAEVLCVGTELLIGDIINTNAAFISARLAMMGISQYHQGVVGDNPERLTKALEQSLGRSDLVILSGGLGPTYDDLTKETAAKLMGRSMHTDEKILEGIRTYFEKTGRVMTPSNAKQALVPEGSVVFENPYGTAPGICIEDIENNKLLVMLPGPPRELEPMFEEKVMPYLSRFTELCMVSHNINIFGMGESTVEAALGGLMQEAKNPTVAPYVSTGEVRLRVTARARSIEECEHMCAQMTERIRESEVGGYIYGVDAQTLEQALLERLKQKGLTLASAESCTGGLVGKRMTDLAGASEVYLGGIISYSNEVKRKLLGVPAEVLDNYGAVSKECALHMARGARAALGADIAVSTTGIAGPSGGTSEKPVGRVYIAVSSALGDTAIELNIAPGRTDRAYVRTLAVSHVLSLALKTAEKL